MVCYKTIQAEVPKTKMQSLLLQDQQLILAQVSMSKINYYLIILGKNIHKVSIHNIKFHIRVYVASIHNVKCHEHRWRNVD